MRLNAALLPNCGTGSFRLKSSVLVTCILSGRCQRCQRGTGLEFRTPFVGGLPGQFSAFALPKIRGYLAFHLGEWWDSGRACVSYLQQIVCAIRSSNRVNGLIS